MKTTTLIIALAAAGTAVLAAAGYTVYYAARYGPNASTPAESWLIALLQRDKLDRELDKILAGDNR